MQRNKISIAKKTLDLLKNKSFNKITFLDVGVDKNNKQFKNKDDLLININRYFDYLLIKNMSTLEESTKKDMLFEIYMARLDILNNHRSSIKNLMKYFLYKPQKLARLIPSFLETIILMATNCKINIDGFSGIPKIKTMFILYFLILYTWSKDETESLEKTMTTLDKYLNNIDKLIKIL